MKSSKGHKIRKTNIVRGQKIILIEIKGATFLVATRKAFIIHALQTAIFVRVITNI